MKTFIFPASGPAFINNNIDDTLEFSDSENTWLIGSSTGALRALTIFYNNSTKVIEEQYCNMIYYPWSTPYSLTNMLKNNISAVYQNKNKILIDIPSKKIPAIIVTHNPNKYIPIFIIIIIALIGYLLGYKYIIYKFLEMHIYIPEWADINKFPLEFDNNIKYKFKILNSSNIDNILYSTIRIPLISTSNSKNCDGGFMFYYFNGKVKKDFNVTDGVHQQDITVTLFSDTNKPTRSIFDSRSINYYNINIYYFNSKNSILDWFNPYYILYPQKRIQKWLK